MAAAAVVVTRWPDGCPARRCMLRLMDTSLVSLLPPWSTLSVFIGASFLLAALHDRQIAAQRDRAA